LFQRPRCVLAARTATEVFPRQQHAGALVTWEVQHELLIDRALGVVLIRLADIVVAPLIKQVRAKTRALDRLQELLGDDLVGVDVGAIQRSNQAGVLGKSFHRLSPQAWINSRTSIKRPVTAAAAAMAGLTRWVRPPAPCRPSKLRLEVDAQCSPLPSLSGFIARHMEQPGSRHSKPASIKILSSPSCSAWALTRP